LGFTDGLLDPSTDTPVDASTSKYATLVRTVPTFANRAWSLPIEDVLGAPNAQRTASSPYYSGYTAYKSDYLIMQGYKMGIPNDAVINGIEIEVTALEPAGGASASLWAKPYGSGLGVESEFMPDPEDVLVYGSDSKNWGLTDVDYINSDDFGVQLQAVVYTTPNPAVAQVNAAQITVHWTAVPGSELFLYDGASDVGKISVATSVVAEGSWLGADAQGYFNLNDWSGIEFAAGLEVWTGAGGTGIRIATTTTSVSIPILPGSLLLEEHKSRY